MAAGGRAVVCTYAILARLVSGCLGVLPRWGDQRERLLESATEAKEISHAVTERHPKVGHTAAKQPSASSDPPAVSLPPRCSQSLLNCCRGDSTCAYGGALDTRAASKSTAPLWARGVREGVRQLIGEERWWLLPRGRGRLKKTALAPGSAAVGSLSAAWEAQGKNGLTPGTNLGRRA